MSFVKPAVRHHRTILALIRHLGPLGLFVFAILDSSPIPTFGVLDIFIAILAARQREPWYYFAVPATAGSVIGAYLTYRIARKAGLEYLDRKFGKKRVATVKKQFERWGTGALVVCTAAPVPLPTTAFFAIAGALEYPLRKFIVAVALCRAARYACISVIASLYGRRFIIAFRNLWQHSALIAAISIILAAAVVVAIVLVKRRRTRQAPVTTRAA